MRIPESPQSPGLSAHATTWTITGLLPLPILVAGDPANSAEIACLYLAVGCGWLAMEIYGRGGMPASTRAWAAKMLALGLAVAANAVGFIFAGLVAGVQTHFPFPLMAALSVFPAIGLIPGLLPRVRRPYMAILLASLLMLAAKLSGCVVARIVYGPNYIAEGYVSDDWRSAKLMISLFWVLSTILSLLFFMIEYLACKRRSAGTDLRVVAREHVG